MSESRQRTGDKVRTAGGPGAPLLTIAICTRNRADVLARAVRSVLSQLREGAEVLIIDNASTDATPRVAAELAAESGAVSVCVEAETGLSVARNRAIREARGSYVVFLDDDAVAEPGWLGAYAGFLASFASDRVGVVGGAVRPEYDAEVPGWYDRRWDSLDLGPGPARLEVSGGVWGCNVGYRREAVQAVGGFDPRLGRNGSGLGAHEESELNRRLAARGYETWWLPAAAIRHVLPGSRLQMRWQLRHLFDQGRSSALVRLESRPHPVAYAVGRLLWVPVQCGLLGLVGLGSLAIGRRQRAARSVMKASRAVGFGRELLQSFGRR